MVRQDKHSLNFFCLLSQNIYSFLHLIHKVVYKCFGWNSKVDDAYNITKKSKV